jgi:Fe-S cluster assembly iron-binding protein IscA
LALDESKNEEQTHTINEIDLMIDANVLPYTKGKEIDYISNAYSQGFSIAATKGTGCC